MSKTKFSILLLAGIIFSFSSCSLFTKPNNNPNSDGANPETPSSTPVTIPEQYQNITKYLTSLDIDSSYTKKTCSDNDPLLFGNPSKATSNVEFKNNYLIEYNNLTISYNNSTCMPNWVGWHLVSENRGSVERSDSTAAQNAGRPGFHADTDLPEGFTQVVHADYTGSGFDRGHQCPSADRTDTEANNDETYLMTNMCPQSSPMNGGTWGSLEDYERDLLDDDNNEVYIFAGPIGIGGTGRTGIYRETYTNSNLSGANTLTIPAYSWKVMLVLPKGSDDVARVTKDTRILAAIIKNSPDCLDTCWDACRVSVDVLEAITGYDFFSELPDEIEDVIEASVDSVEIAKDNLYSVYYPSKPEFWIGDEQLEAGKTYTISSGTLVNVIGYPVSTSVRIYYGEETINLAQYDTQPSDLKYISTKNAQDKTKGVTITKSQKLYAQVTKSTKQSDGTYQISSNSKEEYVEFVIKD